MTTSGFDNLGQHITAMKIDQANGAWIVRCWYTRSI